MTQTQTVTLPQTTVYTYNAVRKRAFQTGFGTGAPYLNSTASATAKATPAGLPADLDDVDPDALGAELEAEVESDPDIAAFEDRYGEDLVSSACSCVFTPTFRTVTETARVTRLAASVITRPALTNFVGTTVTVTVTRPVDVTVCSNPPEIVVPHADYPCRPLSEHLALRLPKLPRQLSQPP